MCPIANAAAPLKAALHAAAEELVSSFAYFCDNASAVAMSLQPFTARHSLMIVNDLSAN
jgi:hypothetical protein